MPSAGTAARADIVIGLIAPVTGPVAAYGNQVKNGAETAIAEINKKGGILGEKVVLKIADDAGEPKQGVSAANQLIGEGIRFVVGPVTSVSPCPHLLRWQRTAFSWSPQRQPHLP